MDLELTRKQARELIDILFEVDHPQAGKLAECLDEAQGAADEEPGQFIVIVRPGEI